MRRVFQSVAVWTIAVVALIWGEDRSLAGTMYVANIDSVSKIDGNDQVTTLAVVNFPDFTPLGVAVDKAGNVYVSNDSDRFVEKFSPTGVDLGVFASFPIRFGGGTAGGLAFDSAGNLYLGEDFAGGLIHKFSPTGVDLGPFVQQAPNASSFAMAFDSHGNLLSTDENQGLLYKYSPAGVELAAISVPGGAYGLAVDKDGTAYVGGFDGGIRKISATGVDLGVIATPDDGVLGLAIGPDGDLYAAYGFLLNEIHRFSLDGQDLGTFATGGGLNFPAGIAFAPVPEPGSWLVLGMGIASLVGSRFMRRRRVAGP